MTLPLRVMLHSAASGPYNALAGMSDNHSVTELYAGGFGSKGTLSRDEWEQPVPDWAFETLWPNTEGRRIEKIRYAMPYSGLMLEVDEFLGALRELVILECEFSTLEQASSFVLPSWAEPAIEVTDEKAYKNKSLALNGIPPYF